MSESLGDMNTRYVQEIADKLGCHRAYIIETIEQLQTRIEELCKEIIP